MAKLAPGDQAPALELTTVTGEPVRVPTPDQVSSRVVPADAQL